MDKGSAPLMENESVQGESGGGMQALATSNADSTSHTVQNETDAHQFTCDVCWDVYGSASSLQEVKQTQASTLD